MEGLSAQSQAQMSFDITAGEGQTAVIRITGELDIANVERLEEAAASVVEAGPERLVVDVGDLRFADSSAIALWVRWTTGVGKLEVRNASPLLRRVITSMGLDRTFLLNP